MLTSFFKNSKPVNFIVLLMFMLLTYSLTAYFNPLVDQELHIGRQILLFLCYILTVVSLHQMSVKNQLTQSNTLAFFLFAGFIATLGLTFIDFNVIAANILCVVGVFKLVKTNEAPKVKGKFFDASIAFLLAGILVVWSILFLVLVFIVIANNGRRDVKNFLIPFVAFGMSLIVGVSVEIIVGKSLFSLGITPTRDFSIYNSARMIVPLSFLLTLLIWCLFAYLSVIKRSSAHLKGGHLTIFGYMFIAIIVTILSTTKNGSELLFLAAPFSIIAANYVQQDGDKLFREILLWIMVLLPFTLFFY